MNDAIIKHWVGRLFLAAALTTSVACGDDDGDDTTTDRDLGTTERDLGTTEDGGTITEDDGGTTTEEDGGGTTTGEWALTNHPCVGNRTDTLWRDVDGTLYVGCGTTTGGDQGLYVSSDEGATWAAPTTNPGDVLDTWRVDDISRSGDLLYVAGIDTAGSFRVLSADTSAATWELAEVYSAGGTVDSSFTVGTFRRDASGRAIAESLTGVDMQMRADDDAEWMALNAFNGGARLQVLDMEVHDGVFYGAGSRIVEPPHLFIENTDAASFTFETIDLATGLGAYHGEMWAIDVDASGVVIGGVDQDADVGFVYTTDLDGGNIQGTSMNDFFDGDATWVHGVCRNGNTLAVAGSFSIREDGFVLLSTDNGATWDDVTPDTGNPASPYPSASECVLTGTHLYVAGKDGSFAVRAL